MKNDSRFIVLSTAILLMILLVPLSLCNATILEVYRFQNTIQDVIDQSSPGDTVLVMPGTYHENLEIVNHGIVLASMYLMTSDESCISRTAIEGTWEYHEEGRGLNVHPLEEPVRIIGLTFRDCNMPSYLGGGGLRAEDVTIEVRSCEFIDNFSDNGGGVRLLRCDASVQSCRFIGNSGRLGGGLRLQECQYEVNGCMFENNNTSYCSGAVCVDYSTGMVVNCSFESNRANSDGGGLFISSTDTCVIDNNTFKGNVAGAGGAVYIQNEDSEIHPELVIQRNQFLRNHASNENEQTGWGGAIFLMDNTGYVEICNNLFEENTTDFIAACICLHNNAEIHHNIFRNNRAEGCPVLFVNLSEDILVDLEYNLFLNNGPVEDEYRFEIAAIVVFSNSILRLTCNDFIGNDGYTFSPVNTLYQYSNNYWGDPSGYYHASVAENAYGDSVTSFLDTTSFSPVPFTSYHAPNIRLPEKVLDFGGVEIGQSSTLNFTVRNGGTEELILYGLTCENEDITIPEFIDSTAGTGVNLHIPIVYTPTEIGPMEAILGVHSNSPYDTLIVVHLMGEGLGTAVDSEDSLLPDEYSMSAPYPNPCNAQTVVRFNLPEPNNVRIALYNLVGREIEVLCSSNYSAGTHSLPISMETIATGMYFIRMDVPGEYHALEKMVVIK